MRRRFLESAILEALWLGPLLGAPIALGEALDRAGPVVPWLLVLLAILIGARRVRGQDLAPLLAVAGCAEAWALSAAAAPADDARTAILLTTLVAWTFLPALAR